MIALPGVVIDFYCIAATSGLKALWTAECLHYLSTALLENITDVISSAFDCVNERGRILHCKTSRQQTPLDV